MRTESDPRENRVRSQRGQRQTLVRTETGLVRTDSGRSEVSVWHQPGPWTLEVTSVQQKWSGIAGGLPRPWPSLWDCKSQKDSGGSFLVTQSHRELEREIKVSYTKIYFLYTLKFVDCDS